jgi:CheY-like chemotaxis protein
LAIENSELCRKLRDADRRKDEFLAALAHDLRNPLAPIQNSIQILKSSRVDVPTVGRVMDMMERQVQHLVRLVDEVRDVPCVMRGKVEVRRQLVDLASVIANAVQAAEALIKDRRHELSISLPSSTLMLDADPVRLAQVVENLLTNAAKFTPPGGRISLAARRDEDFVEVVVRDNGIGIQREMLPRIFELSAPKSSNTAVARGGLGVGLTIAQNLIAQDHGTILASSPGPGKGSEFRVRLPLASHDKFSECRPTVLESAKPTSSEICRLLIVDDNRDAAVSLAMLLRISGHDVRVAHDGPSALELATSFRPEIAFLDLGMPGMDGFEVANRIQKQMDLSNIVLVALTGWGQAQDRQRTKAAGFHHHYVKPMEPDALDRLMSNLRSQRRN